MCEFNDVHGVFVRWHHLCLQYKYLLYVCLCVFQMKCNPALSFYNHCKLYRERSMTALSVPVVRWVYPVIFYRVCSS